jgi:hypothetical protein
MTPMRKFSIESEVLLFKSVTKTKVVTSTYKGQTVTRKDQFILAVAYRTTNLTFL